MPIPKFNLKNSSQDWRENKSSFSAREKEGRYYMKDMKKFNRNRGRQGQLASLIFSRQFLKYAFIIIIIGIVIVMATISRLSKGLPDPNRLMERQIAQSTKIYDRTGKTILYEVSGDIKRTMVTLNDIPKYLQQATISIEDKDFYKHKGISYWAIFRTFITNVLFGKKAGGSTLTQQFVKNAVLSTEKSYTRKIKEAIMAINIEKKFSKDEILQMYFNEIPYGSTAYGVEAASQLYFGKSVKDNTLAESAILAAIPQAPSRYSPYGSNRELLFARQKYILDQMVKNGYINEGEAETAKNEKINFKPQSEKFMTPHFVMYVKEKLAEKYGEKMIEQEGLKIITTLDLYKQETAEEVIKKYGDANIKYNASNGGLVSIDPKTGEILAMVGSRDFFNEDIDGQVNIATSPRQPGSSIKPIIYAASFLKGYTPDTVLYDVVTNFSTDPSKPYEPHNYNLNEYGPVTIRKALAGSLNIPAVKTLYLTGLEKVLSLAKDLGYTTFGDKDRYGLALVLGGGEVKLLEHANAFSAFAREGKIHEPIAILKIEDKNGKVIEEFKDDGGKNVLDAQVARQINSILSDNIARSFIFGERNLLTLGNRPVGVKTGTTNDYRDAWTIGYTPSLVTGVWVGNFDNTPMKKGSAAATIAVPIWHDYMQKVLGDTPIENFNAPAKVETGKDVLDGKNVGEIKVKIDKASGFLATDLTPPSFVDEKVYKQDHCILYYINKDDPRGEQVKNPSDDPQFNLWESAVLKWAEKKGYATSTPPTEKDNLHTSENMPTLNILSPQNNENIKDPVLRVNVEVSAPRGINRVSYYINNNLLTNVLVSPYNLEKQIDFLPNGIHTLKISACDDIDNCAEKSIDLNLSLKNGQNNNSTISISWNSPSSGVSVQSSEFPLSLKFLVSDQTQTARIEVYYIKPASETPELFNTINQIQNSIAETKWLNTPEPGNYKFFGKAFGWNGQTAESSKISITVN